MNFSSISENDTNDTLVLHHQVDNFALYDAKVLLRFYFSKHLSLIDLAIRLRPRPLHGWPFATIQQSKLDTSLVRNARHNTVHCVNLTNQMPFAKPPNRRVAGHHTNSITLHRNKRRGCTHARSRMRSLCARMTTTNNEDFKMFHVKHSILKSLLPKTEAGEYFIQKILDIDMPHKHFKRPRGQTKLCRSDVI